MGEGSANTIYFAYGSNMCPQQMAVRCPGGQAFGQAELRDWQFLINTRTYATIVTKPGAVTYGVLWSLTPGHIAALDDYEAVAEGMYNKTSLIVQGNGEPVRRWCTSTPFASLANRSRTTSKPSSTARRSSACRRSTSPAWPGTGAW